MCSRQKFGKRILKLMGWKSAQEEPIKDSKCILLGVPHTSVVDFIVAWAYCTSIGILPNIMIKKEFFFWPVGPILRSCGAVPVDRASAASMVHSLIHTMDQVDEFHLAIAPEGTRKAVKRWKTGFHLIAKETGSTVYLGYFDWGRKRISVGEPFELTDDVRADMQRIYDHYRPMGLQGLHKDGFIVP